MIDDSQPLTFNYSKKGFVLTIFLLVVFNGFAYWLLHRDRLGVILMTFSAIGTIWVSLSSARDYWVTLTLSDSLICQRKFFSSWKIERALIASWSWIEIPSLGEGARNDITICIYDNEGKRYLIHRWLACNQMQALTLDEWLTKHFGKPMISSSDIRRRA